MIDFITLQTNDGRVVDTSDNVLGRRKVSILFSDSDPETCNLLGNLPHQTEFTRSDLVAFAREILARFADDNDLFERVARNSERSRRIADRR